MTYNLEHLRQLIPEYVNGTITEENKQILDRAVTKYPALQKDLEDFENIEKIYQDINDENEMQDSKYIFKNIINNIHQNSTNKTENKISAFNKIKKTLLSPIISWSLVFAQLVIIVFLFSYNTWSPRFKTSSMSSISKTCRFKINVVFKQNSSEKQIRNLLIEADSSIIGGPLKNDMYVVCLQSKNSSSANFKLLKSSKIVRFIQKSY